jgi:5'-nucleotidase
MGTAWVGGRRGRFRSADRQCVFWRCNPATMEILLTNDDGILAPGLWALHEQLCRDHSVAVVAPDRERSAIGHAITLHEPLRASTVDVNGLGRGLAVNGTPADCVKLGLMELLATRPHMVISGINPGANTGVNVNYSGTVSAAREASLLGLPAIAVSIQGPEVHDYTAAAAFTARLADQLSANTMPRGTFLNVNLPNLPLERIQQVCISRQGVATTAEAFERRVDPRNRVYYWQGGDDPGRESLPDADNSVLRNDCISITPIHCDMTDYGMLETLKQWRLDIRGGTC